jgi:PTS system nitrogen regulatory IIA component
VTERLLSAREVAEVLGFAAGTVVDWAERGDVPAFKIGGRLRFRESEVLDWLEERRVNGPRVTGGEVSPAPTARLGPGLVLQASPVPREGDHDAS